MPSEIYAEEMVHEMQSNLAGMGLTNGRRNSDETSVFMPNQITHRRILCFICKGICFLHAVEGRARLDRNGYKGTRFGQTQE